MSALPILPTSVVGSHGKPGWWFTAVKAWEAEEMGPGDMEEMFDDAVHTAIRDMESAGIDIITDGEVRRTDGYVDTYYRIIKNIAPLPVRRKAGPWGYDQQQRYEAVGRIELPATGFGLVKDFEFLRANTRRAVKATCAGPLTFGSRIHPGRAYKDVVDVAERFAEVINAELKGLVAAGADFIQLDEPARGNVSGEEMARLFNLATDGVRAKLAFHICFGNRFGRSRFPRSYEPYFPGALKARAGTARAARVMKSDQMGSAYRAPEAFGIGAGSSIPTQTPTTRDDVKPTNQASCPSLVVPVLPPDGNVTPRNRAALPVPRSSTSRMSDTI